MEKEIKIIPPDGYEIDEKNSTFECIKFKEIEKCWRKKNDRNVNGYFIDIDSKICNMSDLYYDGEVNNNLFSKLEDAKAALAAAQISMIIDNDERFGGRITDEEWCTNEKQKFIITRTRRGIELTSSYFLYCFIAFHTPEQRNLFLEENEDLIKDYYRIKDEKVCNR